LVDERRVGERGKGYLEVFSSTTIEERG